MSKLLHYATCLIFVGMQGAGAVHATSAEPEATTASATILQGAASASMSTTKPKAGGKTASVKTVLGSASATMPSGSGQAGRRGPPARPAHPAPRQPLQAGCYAPKLSKWFNSGETATFCGRTESNGCAETRCQRCQNGKWLESSVC